MTGDGNVSRMTGTGIFKKQEMVDGTQMIENPCLIKKTDYHPMRTGYTESVVFKESAGLREIEMDLRLQFPIV
jgi:hypothetical protein